MKKIHESSSISPNSVIGEDTVIWQNCIIQDNVEIGQKCNIGANVFIEKGVRIGNGVKIKNNIAIYSGVKIEDDVFLGPNCVFTNVINPRSFIERKKEFKETIVKKGATIGANATVICGNIIGKYSMVGAGTVVTKSIPDYSLMIGNPGRIVGFICECGCRISNNSSDSLSNFIFANKNEICCTPNGEITIDADRVNFNKKREKETFHCSNCDKDYTAEYEHINNQVVCRFFEE